MAQVDKLPVNELPVTQSVASSDKVMVLTDNTNNIVNNITIADLNDSNISSDADNSIETGSDGKLYVESPEVITGDLTDLTTDDKTNLVAAINEVDGDISTVETTTGDLNDLETLTKTSLVDAINEIYNTQSPQLQTDYVRTAKAMLENTTTYSNSTIYSDVYSYNHSTSISSMDTIKPANYSITGTPTITADGIASGFSTSNYLTKSSACTISSNGEFRIDFKYSGTQHTSIQYLFDSHNTPSNEIFVRREANGNSYVCTIFNGGTAIFSKTITDSSNAITGFIEYKNGVYTFDVNGTQQTATSSNKPNATTYNLSIGVRLSSGSPANPLVNGSIDLNGIKISVDSDLVYQPCLLIPYNQSSTGSKIVDVAYRDRVTDVYQQYGKALYYTIDEINENITLPMGEVYGFIEENTKQVNINTSAIATKQTVGDWCTTAPTTVATATLNKPVVIVDNYLNGTDGYIKFSDGLIIQWGHFDGSSGTVNLIRNFATTDYDIQIKINNSNSSPNTQYYYTTKSNNSFTVGAHSTSFPFDWFAIGH